MTGAKTTNYVETTTAEEFKDTVSDSVEDDDSHQRTNQKTKKT